MIDINEAKAGDCVYVLLTIQTAPVYGEIVRVLDKENAIEVATAHWGNRVVIAQNAYWEEKLAKKEKIVRIEHNYSQWAKEYFRDEETETDNRIDSLYNGQSTEDKDSGQEQRNDPIQESPKRKQKVVRKSTKRKRAIKRNRKTRSRKE
ncbi:MAG: hypothetical protein VXZ51_04835 [Actinomycetota bacterium]|nr:hypothetical protein [Actinomycetota bacterium]